MESKSYSENLFTTESCETLIRTYIENSPWGEDGLETALTTLEENGYRLITSTELQREIGIKPVQKILFIKRTDSHEELIRSAAADEKLDAAQKLYWDLHRKNQDDSKYTTGEGQNNSNTITNSSEAVTLEWFKPISFESSMK